VEKDARKAKTSAFGSGGGGGGEGGGGGGDGSDCPTPILPACWHCEMMITVIDECDPGDPGGTGGGGCHPCGCPGCGSGDGRNPNVFPPKTSTGLGNFASALGKPLPAGWQFNFVDNNSTFGNTRPFDLRVDIFNPAFLDSVADLKATIIHEETHVGQCRSGNHYNTPKSAASFLNQLEAVDHSIEYVRDNGLENTPVSQALRTLLGEPTVTTLLQLLLKEQAAMIASLRARPGGEAYYQTWRDPNASDRWYQLIQSDRLGHCP
jgi:hypothetical protein